MSNNTGTCFCLREKSACGMLPGPQKSWNAIQYNIPNIPPPPHPPHAGGGMGWGGGGMGRGGGDIGDIVLYCIVLFEGSRNTKRKRTITVLELSWEPCPPIDNSQNRFVFVALLGEYRKSVQHTPMAAQPIVTPHLAGKA